ncbi:hypothetical protein [Propylenella binzhouense]|uniref:Type II toxin-antitoxin system HicA family toxin n=1 Tax=Propylenella binzhouense TaxID=2555902 RepID=A0A964T9M0_9HYPH|nr:hypothetical protein [Propylenella binzhouense]MYZ49857.1 hypothetical protein [Propylenella binzhouense]
MNRESLIRALRKYARTNGIAFEVDTRKGKGAHYRIRLGDRITTVQSDLNPGRIERILRQLGVKLRDL